MIESIEKVNDTIIVVMKGTLDISKQGRFKDELLKQVPSDKTKLILDFQEVNFIDSACLGALISIVRTLRNRGGDVLLFGLQNEVRSIFQITRLDKVFKVFETRQDALTACSS